MLKYRLTTKTLKDKEGNVKGKQNRIIVETALDLTPQEQAIIDSYVRNGYKMMVSQKGEKKATGKGMTADKILQYLYDTNNTNYSDALKVKIKNSENYMSICQWLREDKILTDEVKEAICKITPKDETTKEVERIRASRNEEENKA